LVREWFEKRGVEAIFTASVGQDPSLVDILKMVHPKPLSAEREALYGYLIGREHKREALPEVVRRFEAFKTGASREVPDVPFQMLTALELGQAEWMAIILPPSSLLLVANAGWEYMVKQPRKLPAHLNFGRELLPPLVVISYMMYVRSHAHIEILSG
jgi:hypothetical protein